MMRKLLNRPTLLTVLLFVLLSVIAFPASAGDVYLTNNRGSENAVFFIKDEPSLVINGFDLTPLGMELPTALDAISISVESPVPGSIIDVVVYQDANGGSPIDAELVHRQTVSMNRPGVNRIELDRAAIITEPVVWVGFYLPVDFRFYADQSGSSPLTYWAWTPAGTFDLNSLANAAILGPGDGTEPVEISMEGIARITAETRTPDYDETAAAFPLTEQMTTASAQDTSLLRDYEDCHNLAYDPADNSISTGLTFPLYCRHADTYETPYQIANPPDQILEVDRRGQLFKLSTFLTDAQLVPGRSSQLPVRVTHCLRIPSDDLESAVLGEVRESETAGERWYILPSVRMGEVVCAEVSVANYLSYFVPRTAESAPNINLVVGWTEVHPHPLYCGAEARLRVPIVNTGLSWFKTDSGHVSVAVEDFHVGTGISTTRYVLQVNTDQFGPGVRRVLDLGPIFVEQFVDELHRIEVRLDDENKVPETNEADNIWVTEYILRHPPWDDEECGPEPVERRRRPFWVVGDNCRLSLRTMGYGGLNFELLELVEDAVRKLSGETGEASVTVVTQLDTPVTTETDVDQIAAEVRSRLEPLFRAEDWERLRRIWGTRTFISGRSAHALRNRAACGVLPEGL
ncbi:MAG: hypothetical protein OXG53_05560 [Chloroflexi bacterium]|nr:hypothetical protein [Chloroflexota bacterium]